MTISAWVKVDTYGDNNIDYIFDIGRNADSKRIGLGINSNGFSANIGGVSSDIFTVNASSSSTSWP